MKSINIVIFLVIITVSQNYCHRPHKFQYDYHLMNILKSRNNFFREFSKTTQKVVNSIFYSLRVTEKFANKPKIKTLLTMHRDLSNIAEKNFELYDVLRNASTVDVNEKPINQIRVKEIIIETLNDKDFNDSIDTESDNYEKGLNTPRAESFSSEFANIKVLKEFIGGFIGKLKKLSVDDLFPNKDNQNLSESEQSGRRNLQIWEPPQLTETGDTYNMGNRRIYRGQTTHIESYPFMVSVHVKEQFTCAGSIISVDLIITAASCSQLPLNTYVRLNSDYTSLFGEQIPVLEIYLYPQYDPKTLHHNLAILRLQRSLKTSRISLDRGNSNIPPNSEITILGWGAKKPNQYVNKNETLAYAVLTSYHIDECKEIYSKTYVTENNFCAGFKSIGSGACNRDVGGPGIIDNLLFGVISFGAPVCGDSDAPTVFTRVVHYIDWIDHIMSLLPIRQEIATNIKPGDDILIYFNNHQLRPVNTHQNRGPMKPALRVNSGDRVEDPDNAFILNEIINDMNNKNVEIPDQINDNLYKEYVDIFKPDDQSIINHPLINKTHFLIPGIHYNVTTVKLSSAVTSQYTPTFLLSFTPSEILRHKKEPK